MGKGLETAVGGRGLSAGAAGGGSSGSQDARRAWPGDARPAAALTVCSHPGRDRTLHPAR